MTAQVDDVSSAGELPEWQQARRQQIVDAALHLLTERTFEQIQIREVAMEAGVALGTLYRYFDSKDHLYAVALSQWNLALRGPEPKTRKHAVARLRSKMHFLLASFDNHPNVWSMQRTLSTNVNPKIQDLLADYRNASSDWFWSDLDVLGKSRARDVRSMLLGVTSELYNQTKADGNSRKNARRIGDRFIDLIAEELKAAEAEAK